MRKTIHLLFVLLIIYLISCTSKKDNIFNGINLSNWNFVLEDDNVSADDVFFVKGDVICISGDHLGYMYTKKRYDNFTLELEYRWEDDSGNSGIFLLIDETSSPFPKAVECQLMNQNAGDFVLLCGADMDEYSNSMLDELTDEVPFPIIKKNAVTSEKSVGEWNKAEISVYDGVIDVFINDVHQNTGISSSKTGHIGLQSEGGQILFRNLKLTEFD